MADQAVRALDMTVATIFRDPAFASRLAVLGMNISQQGSAQYETFMQQDLRRYSAIVERLHLRQH